MSRDHWIMSADVVSDGDPRILGEDDRGDWFVPSRTRPEFWDRPFRWWNPTHWPFYARSRATKRVAFLEPTP